MTTKKKTTKKMKSGYTKAGEDKILAADRQITRDMKRSKKMRTYIISSGGFEATIHATNELDAFDKFIDQAKPTGLGLLTQISINGQVFYALTTRLLEQCGRMEEDSNG